MRFSFFIILSVFVAAACASPVKADLYKYVDARGVCHYSNVPGDSRYKAVTLRSLPKKRHKRLARTVRRPRVRKYSRNSWPFASDSGYSVSYRTRRDPLAYDKHIQRAARVHGIDPLLIKAIIKTESDFNPRAVSSQGAVGLMQLMPATARDMKVRNRYDARQNILGGTRYLKELLKSYKGNLQLSLAAYNAGPGRVKNSIPSIPETVNYVSKVLRFYRDYRKNAERSSSGHMVSVN